MSEVGYMAHRQKMLHTPGLVVRAGVGKLRPAGRMRPSRAFCAAREHFLKLCHLEINTTRGLTRRKSDGVLKKMAIASTLDGKCVRQLPSTKR